MVLWLWGCCFMVVAMMVIGAITRLTESGLSMVEWRPLIGALPPFSDPEWNRIFRLYKQTSQYQLANEGMTLGEFKTIFWWEFIHRLWGRLIGVVFAVPMLFFWITKRIPPGFLSHFIALFFLGGLQGVIGWWMVKSGFVDRTEVSQYRLTVHLGMAFAILGYLEWVALRLMARPRFCSPHPLRRAALAVLLLSSLTVLAGGLVAGSNAGMVYNTWPLMEGGLAPPTLFGEGWISTFEDHGTIQFNHRVLAYITIAAILFLFIRSRRHALAGTAKRAVTALFHMVIFQAALGIATLMFVVPLPLAVLHQLGAAITFCLSVWAVHALTYQPVNNQ